MEKIEHNQRNIGHSVFPALVYFCCQFLAHPTNPVECCADANPKTMLPNDT